MHFSHYTVASEQAGFAQQSVLKSFIYADRGDPIPTHPTKNENDTPSSTQLH